jgi:hypothetical protein
VGFFAKVKAALERKQYHVPIWTPIGPNKAVALPDPKTFLEPIFVSANYYDVEVYVSRVGELNAQRPTINGVLVFIIPKGEMACFHSDGENYFAELGAEKWI